MNKLDEMTKGQDSYVIVIQKRKVKSLAIVLAIMILGTAIIFTSQNAHEVYTKAPCGYEC